MEQLFTDQQRTALSRHMNVALIQASERLEAGKVPVISLLIDPKTLEIVAESPDTSDENALGHATMNCIAARASMATENDYICSGLWLVTTKEPCPMCAMAAVHSRVGAVFYSASDSDVGALGSRFNLHLEPQLNHHYPVYRHLSGAEGQRIWHRYTCQSP